MNVNEPPSPARIARRHGERAMRVVAFVLALGFVASAGRAASAAAIYEFSTPSSVLGAFFNHPVKMRAQVLVPDDYDRAPQRRYPAIYYVHAFGPARPTYAVSNAWRAALAAAPESFVLVLLDATYPAGHNAFVDSANDGPWGTALTTEFIPALEANVRLEPRASGRFLVGHSSGGWSSLWLQVNYPQLFGGVWSIAPDPVDFHDFTGPNIADTPPQNFFRGPHGLWPIYRVQGRDRETLRRFVRDEDAKPGGQFDSFEAVFSPRGANGKPQQLFDRRTGDVDPAVAAYWEAHYDIAALVRRSWPELAPQLAAKLNIFVGTQDTYHLETSVARLAEVLRDLGSDARVTFARDCDHWSIFDYEGGLFSRIVREMHVTRASQFSREPPGT